MVLCLVVMRSLPFYCFAQPCTPLITISRNPEPFGVLPWDIITRKRFLESSAPLRLGTLEVEDCLPDNSMLP
jgi:hypothetical protein